MKTTIKSKSNTATVEASKVKLKHIANVFDQITGTAQETIQFTDMHDKKRKITIDREVFKDPKSLHSILIKHNARISFDYFEAELALEELIQQKSKHVISVANNGWLLDNQLYASPLGIFGTQPDTEHILSEQLKSFFGNKHQMLGSVEGWIENVASVSLYSRIGTFSLCAAFAAPLVRFTGLQNFSFNVFGLAKIGKSTVAIAAASFSGIGMESDLLNHQTTQSAYNEVFRYYNDHLVVINEMSLAKSGINKVYNAVHDLTYRFSEGQINRVNSKSSYATNPDLSKFKGILLTNSERSIDEYARQIKAVRQEGEYARMLCLPAKRIGYKTVMDILPKDIQSEAVDSWTREKMVQLRNSCLEHHGYASKAYIEYLINNCEELKDKIENYRQDFLKGVDSSILQSYLRHAAENFSLVYAGGCLAVEAGMLPTKPVRIRKLFLELFHEATANIVESKQSLDEILTEELNDYLAHAKIVSIKTYRPFYRKDDANGYMGYYTRKNGEITYHINSKFLREQFSGTSIFDLLSMLNSRSYLKINPDKSEKGGTEWATHQKRFGKTNDRYFIFKWHWVKPVQD